MDTWNQTLVKSYIHKIVIQKNAFKMSSANWRPFCLGINVLMEYLQVAENYVTSVVNVNKETDILLYACVLAT